MNVITAARLHLLTSSTSLRNARICETVLLPGLKPFWFFLSSGSSTGLILIRMQAQYYQVLYTDNVTKNENEMKMYLKEVITPSITEEDSLLCNDLLTFEECEKTLGMMKNNKTPGNDGLTVEFYRCFWKYIGPLVVDSFNFSYEYGQLSSSQRQAVIVLLDKGKDRTLLKNWRPISILNVDYKILSKTIAERLKKVLPGIVHYDQSGFITGENSLLTGL